MQTIYAVYLKTWTNLDPWTKVSEFYSSLESAEKALATIKAFYREDSELANISAFCLEDSDLTIQELSVYDFNMEEN